MGHFEVAARSAIGLVRTGNEDSALTSQRVLAVADGMGGHAAGEVASKIAIETLEKISAVITSDDIDAESADDIFTQTLNVIDSELAAYVDEKPELKGMGTTFTSLYARAGKVALLHIGDSRAYRLRGNTFEQLSVDHTVIAQLLASGTITEADISTHPQRSVLTQVLMGEGQTDSALVILEAKTQDRYLLCSDGLSSVLSDKEMKSLIKGKERSAAVDALIEATYVNGAPDNVTVIVADYIDGEATSGISKLGAAQ